MSKTYNLLYTCDGIIRTLVQRIRKSRLRSCICRREEKNTKGCDSNGGCALCARTD